MNVILKLDYVILQLILLIEGLLELKWVSILNIMAKFNFVQPESAPSAENLGFNLHT